MTTGVTQHRRHCNFHLHANDAAFLPLRTTTTNLWFCPHRDTITGCEVGRGLNSNGWTEWRVVLVAGQIQGYRLLVMCGNRCDLNFWTRSSYILTVGSCFRQRQQANELHCKRPKFMTACSSSRTGISGQKYLDKTRNQFSRDIVSEDALQASRMER